MSILYFKLDYLVWFFSSINILDINPLSDLKLVKIFPYIGCHFDLLTVSFALLKLFIFTRYYILIVLSGCTMGVLFRNLTSVPVQKKTLWNLQEPSKQSLLVIRDMKPSPPIFYNHASLPSVGMRHQPSYKTFNLLIVPSMSFTGVMVAQNLWNWPTNDLFL